MRPPRESYLLPVRAARQGRPGRLGDWVVRLVGVAALLAIVLGLFLLLVHLRITGG